jgi:hypothetical protein
VLKASETRIDPAPPSSVDVPWAVALNATDTHDDVSVTLLTLSVVDDLMRITALLRVSGHTGLRVLSMPTLEVATPDGQAAALLEARMQPRGAVGWASWTYERHGVAPGRIDARIDRMELAHRIGGNTCEQVEGPWTFHLAVETPVRGDAEPASGPGA